MGPNAKLAVTAAIGAAVGAAVTYALEKSVKAATSTSGGTATWIPATFTASGPSVLPGAGGAVADGAVALQDTGHGGPSGALVIARVGSISGAMATGVVTGVVSNDVAAGPSPIQTGDTVQFNLVDVLASAASNTALIGL